MPNYIVSPNMKLTVPVVSLEQGPLYASDINASLGLVDSHDHSNGKGVPVTPQGLSITSDLSFISNSATNLFSSSYISQGSALNTGIYKGALYVVGNELYYNDVTGGHQVPITNQGNVNAGAGSITGLTSYPSASASYNGLNGSFVWQQGVNTSADMDFGSAIMRNDTASSFGLTLSPPTLTSNYAITLPLLPSSQKIMTLDASGLMTAPYTVDGTTLTISSNVISVGTGGITTTQISPTAGILGTQIASATIAGTNVQTLTVSGSQGGNLQQATVSPYNLTTNYLLIGPNTFTLSNTTTSINLGSFTFAALADGSGRIMRISFIGGSCVFSASGGNASLSMQIGTHAGPTIGFLASGGSQTTQFGSMTSAQNSPQAFGSSPTFYQLAYSGTGGQTLLMNGSGTTWSAAYSNVQILFEII